MRCQTWGGFIASTVCLPRFFLNHPAIPGKRDAYVTPSLLNLREIRPNSKPQTDLPKPGRSRNNNLTECAFENTFQSCFFWTLRLAGLSLGCLRTAPRTPNCPDPKRYPRLGWAAADPLCKMLIHLQEPRIATKLCIAYACDHLCKNRFLRIALECVFNTHIMKNAR